MSSSSRTTFFYVILFVSFGLLAYCDLLYKKKTGNFVESTVQVQIFKLTKFVLIISK